MNAESIKNASENRCNLIILEKSIPFLYNTSLNLVSYFLRIDKICRGYTIDIFHSDMLIFFQLRARYRGEERSKHLCKTHFLAFHNYCLRDDND